MEIRHLRYFITAAEEENFNRAADRLYVSQPALSRRIKDLESELGVKLFNRKNKRVTLSQTGQAFYKDIKKTLDDLESAKQRIRSYARGEVGTLTIGLNDSVIRHKIVKQALQKFSSLYPNVNLRLDPIVPNSLVDVVLEGGVDAALLFSRPQNNPALDYVELDREDFVVALPKSHCLASKKELCLADLNGEMLVWFRREIAPNLYDKMIAACQSGGLTLNIGQYVSSETIRLQLVSVGMGFTFLTSSMQEYGVPDNVVVREVSDLSIPLELDLAWRRENDSPVLAHFVSVARELADMRGNSTEL